MKADDLPSNYNAISILEHNLRDREGKLALLSDDCELTFGQVSMKVNQVANALRGIGTRLGDRIAIMAPDCEEWVEVFFGTIKVGGIAVSMNTLLTTSECRFVLEDCQPIAMVVHEDQVPKVVGCLSGISSLSHLIVIGRKFHEGMVLFSDWIRSESEQALTVTNHRDDYCMLNYTSGTTGHPKGVFHSHKDLPIAAELWGVCVLGLQESDRCFGTPRLSFTYGTGGVLVFPWFVGATCVLMKSSPRQTECVVATIQKFVVSILYNVPTGYSMMLAMEDFPRRYDIRSLRRCVSAGEPLPVPIWQKWKTATGIELIDGLGSTELFHIFLSNRPSDIRLGSTGKPVPGYRVRIVNDAYNDVPQGEPGRLLVSGETASLFYLHQFAASRRAFLGEWVDTGDRFVEDNDGYFWYLGRSDDMLKVGGFWVSPIEVERVLYEHPAVKECVVVGRNDIEGLVKPHAFIVLNVDFEMSDTLKIELTAYCIKHMIHYKRPRSIDFVESLPKTITEKIQRFKLRNST